MQGRRSQHDRHDGTGHAANDGVISDGAKSRTGKVAGTVKDAPGRSHPWRPR